MSAVMRMRAQAFLDLAQLWRWRRVRRRGVVLTSTHHPRPDGIAYTWNGRRVGNGTRDQLAAMLAGPAPRPPHWRNR